MQKQKNEEAFDPETFLIELAEAFAIEAKRKAFNENQPDDKLDLTLFDD